MMATSTTTSSSSITLPKCAIDTIELKNFKSYRGTHVIGPFLQFSCIIGPNGSGKSNLLDAITFVLGISYASSSSRSTVAQLVFRNTSLGATPPTPAFHGSFISPPLTDQEEAEEIVEEEVESESLKKRASTGAPVSKRIIESYVKLKYRDLKNNGKEYIFMRKIKGNGTSYFIDSKAVKRDDYLETLASLGIHSACPNFCVLQGDVTTLATKDPREITNAIERISGSSQYKEEYDSLLKQKAEVESQSLNTYTRVKYLVAEKDSCKQQFTEYQQYVKAVKERETITIKTILLELRFIRDDLDRLQKQRDSALKEIQQIEAEKENISNEKKQANKKQASKHKEIMETEFKLKKLTVKKGKVQPNVYRSTEEIKILQDKSKKIQDMIEQATKNRSLQQKTLEMLNKQQNEIQEKLEQIDLTQEVEKGLSLTNDQIELYNNLKIQAGKVTSEDKKKLDQLVRTQTFEIEKKTSKEATIDDWTKMIEHLDLSTKQLQDRKQQIQYVLTDLDQKINDLSDQVTKSSSRNDSQQKKQQTLTKELEQIQFKLSTERSYRNEKERDKKLNYAVSECKKLYPGVKGKLIDLCKPRNKYDTALAVALGKLADAVVVETEEAANMCMTYFKEQMVGICTFLPLERLVDKPVNEKLRKLGGDGRTAKLLIDCVEFDPHIGLAVRYALGNLLVCSTLQEARLLAFSAERHKVITVDGIKITKSGFMSGGLMGVKDRASKFNVGDVEELKKRREVILEELSEIERTYANFYELDKMKHDLEELKSQALLNRETLKPIDDRMKKNANEKESKINLIAGLDKEIDQIKKSIAERQVTIDQVKATIEKEEKGIFADFCKQLKISNIQEFEVNRMEKLHKQTQEKLELSLQLSKIQNQIDFEGKKDYSSDINQLDIDLKSNAEKLEKEIKSQHTKEDEGEKLKAQITEMTEKLTKLKDEIFELNNTIKSLKTSSDEKSKRHEELEGVAKDLKSSIDNHKAEYHRLLANAKTKSLKLPLLKDDEMDIDEEQEEEEKEKEEDEEEKEEDSDKEMKDSSDEENKRKKQPPRSPAKSPKKSKKKDDSDDQESDDEKKKHVPKSPAKSPKKSPGKGLKRKVGQEDEEEGQDDAHKKKTAEEKKKSEEDKKKKEEDEERKRMFKLLEEDDDEEIEEEEQKGDDNANNFLDLVQMLPWDYLIPDSERDEFFDKHLKIRIDFRSIAKYKAKTSKELQPILKELDKDYKRLDFVMDKGPNPKAFEQLKKVTEELKSLRAKHREDNQQAKTVLVRFAQVKNQRQKLFVEAFDKIAENIGKIYVDLTKDLYPPYEHLGEASLELEDTDSPFNAGIIFNATPPNKRHVGEINQLSGGEKSIAALALLFAMHKFRPSPFFILDEVDAAFDSINVIKLIRYIRTVQPDLQFIVISLKDLFFSNSDGLVGVCRNIEDSTSNTITISLDDLPPTHVEVVPVEQQKKMDQTLIMKKAKKFSRGRNNMILSDDEAERADDN